MRFSLALVIVFALLLIPSGCETFLQDTGFVTKPDPATIIQAADLIRDLRELRLQYREAKRENDFQRTLIIVDRIGDLLDRLPD